jgi:hypothetical protein
MAYCRFCGSPRLVGTRPELEAQLPRSRSGGGGAHVAAGGDAGIFGCFILLPDPTCAQSARPGPFTNTRGSVERAHLRTCVDCGLP